MREEKEDNLFSPTSFKPSPIYPSSVLLHRLVFSCQVCYCCISGDGPSEKKWFLLHLSCGWGLGEWRWIFTAVRQFHFWLRCHVEDSIAFRIKPVLSSSCIIWQLATAIWAVINVILIMFWNSISLWSKGSFAVLKALCVQQKGCSQASPSWAILHHDWPFLLWFY